MNTGIFTFNGQQYVEKPQIFPIWLQNVANNQVLLNQQVATPGTYMFRLKSLARDVIVYAGGSSLNGVGSRASRPFLFRLGGTSDTSWYYGGAVPLNTSGVQTDRVLDTNCFGSGQFPFPLIPDILYPAGSNITFEVQDVANNGNYDIHFAFSGAYLVPLDTATNSLIGSNS